MGTLIVGCPLWINLEESLPKAALPSLLTGSTFSARASASSGFSGVTKYDLVNQLRDLEMRLP